MTIKEWLRTKIAEEADINIESIDDDMDFSRFKLDSLSTISITFDLEEFIDKELDPTIFSEHNTINKLVEWLSIKK